MEYHPIKDIINQSSLDIYKKGLSEFIEDVHISINDNTVRIDFKINSDIFVYIFRIFKGGYLTYFVKNDIYHNIISMGEKDKPKEYKKFLKEYHINEKCGTTCYDEYHEEKDKYIDTYFFTKINPNDDLNSKLLYMLDNWGEYLLD